MDKFLTYRVEIIARVEASSLEHAQDQVRWSASKLDYPIYVGQARPVRSSYEFGAVKVERDDEIES